MRDIATLAMVMTAVAAGCTSTSEMLRYAPEPGGEVGSPGPDEAVVLFLRSGLIGGAVVAHLFERSEDGRIEFFAVLTANTHVVRRVAPGRHVFAVTNEGVGFIEVHAEGGRIYPIVVAPRFGLVKARFALLSACPGTEKWKDVSGWFADGRRVELNERAARWWSEREADLTERINERWSDWQTDDDRVVIQAGDGATGLSGGAE